MKQYEIMLTLLQRNRYVEAEYAKRMGVRNPRNQANVLRNLKGYDIKTIATGIYSLKPANNEHGR